MTDGTDFSDPTQWTLTASATGYRTVGTGFIACVFPSKRPNLNKFGGWLKRFEPGFAQSETLALFWADSLHELFLRLELARRKQIAIDQDATPTTPDPNATNPDTANPDTAPHNRPT